MPLFKDRTLNIAILISIAWHLAFMFSFSPVINTGRIIEHKASISFLGGILGSIVAGNERFSMPDYVSLRGRMGEPGPAEEGFINAKQDKKEFTAEPLYNQALFDPNLYHRKEVPRIKFSDFFIKGDARDRIIIYKPDLDKVIILPSDFNSDFSAGIRFRVSKDGFVQYAECAASSGFPEIDQAAIRYVREWQFAPAAKGGQEGTARINFD